MMTLKDIAEWLETKVPEVEVWRIGSYDNSNEKTVCIRNLASNRERMTLGGKDFKTTRTKGVSIIVHWNKSPNGTEIVAQSIYDLFYGEKPTLGEYQTILCNMRNDEPVSLGTDENGIYEYVIEMWVTYKGDRKE